MSGASGPRFDQTRIVSGIWEGVLTGANDVPVLKALHDGRMIDHLEVVALTGQAGSYLVRVPIPSWVMSEGVQTILLQSDGQTIAQTTVIAGQPLDRDIRTELSLLRAELDLLKGAFQRHVRGLAQG